MKHKLLFLFIIASLILLPSFVLSQGTKQPTKDETKAEVPALDNFHDVIYKIWHTAWPEKDVKMLAELFPEFFATRNRSGKRTSKN